MERLKTPQLYDGSDSVLVLWGPSLSNKMIRRESHIFSCSNAIN